jgi:RNA polymerase sigma-70 factor, ECF subfamily
VDELDRLVARARGGDEPAFAAFIRATYRPVWTVCAQLAGPADADDAAQETFLAAWQALPSFRGEASAKTWLLVIARRTALRVARRRRRWLELADAHPRAPLAAQGESPGTLQDLLSEMDIERKMALVLTQVIGLTYAEAATVCDCPIGTIRSRVARARAELLRRRAAERGAASS